MALSLKNRTSTWPHGGGTKHRIWKSCNEFKRIIYTHTQRMPTHIHMHTHMYTHACIYMHIYVCTPIYTHTHVYMQTHMCTHTHAYTRFSDIRPHGLHPLRASNLWVSALHLSRPDSSVRRRGFLLAGQMSLALSLERQANGQVCSRSHMIKVRSLRADQGGPSAPELTLGPWWSPGEGKKALLSKQNL